MPESSPAPAAPPASYADRGSARPDLRWQYALAAAHTPRGRSAMRWTNPQAPVPRAGHSHALLQDWLVTVKDLFDVAGQVSAAGSLVLADAAPAPHHATTVARLLQAGAHLMGRSHMVEFAFSGIGINPHFSPVIAVDAHYAEAGQACTLPPARCVSGGSSSGAALSVALGIADAALGSDTGGSIRIPAAFNGLTGFKSTRALVPGDGMLALSPTLDVPCAITRNVADAITVHEVLAARRVVRSPASLGAWRLAVVRDFFFEDSDAATRSAFERSLERLRQAGARIDSIALPEMLELKEFAHLGSIAAAESYAEHHSLLARAGDRYDPRVRQRMEAGARMSACDYLRLQQLRRQWQARMEAALAGFDAILSPTVAITAPAYDDLAPGSERDAIFARTNALVLRNTSAINFLDGPAISIPCHLRGESPVGLMLWHGSGHDDAVLNLALLAEQALAKT